MKTLSHFEIIARKNKRKQLWRNIILSSVGSLILIGGIYTGLNTLTSRNGEEVKERYLLLSDIAYPNLTYSTWGFEPSSRFTGTFYSDRFKDIDGITVPFNSFEANYSLLGSGIDNTSDGQMSGDNRRSSYTRLGGYKVPVFYNIHHDYTKKDEPPVTQDIDLADQMSDQALEMAITFDKPYTLAEIQNLVPDDLKLNWYWVGTDSKIDTSWLSLSDTLGMAHNEDANMTLEQSKAWSKAADEAIKKDPESDLSKISVGAPDSVDVQTSLENSYTFFQDNLTRAAEKGYLDSRYSDDSGELDLVNDAKEYLKANKDPKTAKFSGVIVTGRAEKFTQLKGAKWIFASNIGQTVTVQPYHQLEK